MLLSVLWCTDRGGSISHAQDVLESSQNLNQNGYGCAYVCTCEGVCIVCHTCAYYVYINIDNHPYIYICVYIISVWYSGVYSLSISRSFCLSFRTSLSLYVSLEPEKTYIGVHTTCNCLSLSIYISLAATCSLYLSHSLSVAQRPSKMDIGVRILRNPLFLPHHLALPPFLSFSLAFFRSFSISCFFLSLSHSIFLSLSLSREENQIVMWGYGIHGEWGPWWNCHTTIAMEKGLRMLWTMGSNSATYSCNTTNKLRWGR